MRFWNPCFLLLGSLCFGAALSGCGSSNLNWYTAGGQACGQGTPHPGCDYYSNGTKILMFSDPFYTPAQVQGLKTWVSTDQITYDVATGVALS